MSALIPGSLTGGFLESFGLSPTVPTQSPIEFFRANLPDLGALTQSFATITQAAQPTISAGLFERVRQNISEALQLGRTQRVQLGEAAVDISQALSEQVAIREEQLARTQEAIRNQQIATTAINERLSAQVTELGESFKGFDPIKFFTDNPVFAGLGIGGLLVGGVVLLLLLRR